MTVTLKFGADGTLLHTVHERNKDQIMRLTYTVDEEFVVTSQPSKPRIEKTRYELTPDGKRKGSVLSRLPPEPFVPSKRTQGGIGIGSGSDVYPGKVG